MHGTGTIQQLLFHKLSLKFANWLILATKLTAPFRFVGSYKYRGYQVKPCDLVLFGTALYLHVFSFKMVLSSTLSTHSLYVFRFHRNVNTALVVDSQRPSG